MPTPEIIFALAFILYTFFRVLRGRTGATWLHLVLALLVIAPLSISSITASQLDNDSSATMLAVRAAGALIVAGGVVFLVERRKTKLQWNQSQAVLSLIVGGLVMLSVIVGPVVNQVMTGPTLENVAAAQDDGVVALPPTPTNAIVVAAAISNSEVVVPLNTLAPTMPPVQVDVVGADVVALLPTRFIYTTPTPTATLEAAAVNCEGRVQTHLNVRSGPSVETLVVVSMPPYTSVTVHNRNADATWLYIEYESVSGWASAEFVNLSENCHDLPVFEGS